MKKIVKKWGDSSVIVLTPEECKIYNITVGSVVDISDITVVSEDQEFAEDQLKGVMANKERMGVKG